MNCSGTVVGSSICAASRMIECRSTGFIVDEDLFLASMDAISSRSSISRRRCLEHSCTRCRLVRCFFVEGPDQITVAPRAFAGLGNATATMAALDRIPAVSQAIGVACREK